MEEQLISFDTAKLAKEKKFNIPCENFYIEYIDDDVADLFNYEEQRGSGYAELYRNNQEFKYSAPTQSLLQKWLREVHKINVESNYLPNVEKYRCLFIPMTLKKPSEYSTPGTAFTSRFNYLGKEHYNTYEEALEIGLYQALLLI